MIENKNIRIVKEDAVVGNGCNRFEKSFGYGYDEFQFPLTVSFCSDGKYTVVIEGKKAIIKKEDTEGGTKFNESIASVGRSK
jgi:hypothetical protein